MVKHIVFFKSPNDTLTQELKNQLLTLKAIPYIANLEVGIDFVKSERSFDLSLIVDLQSYDDLKRYAEDPLHLPVVNWVRQNGFVAASVDYEY